VLLNDFIKQDRKVQELEANALRLQCATNQRLQLTRFASRDVRRLSALSNNSKRAFAKTPRA
jgi:hypothetical protein